jgi:hypothetical protein
MIVQTIYGLNSRRFRKNYEMFLVAGVKHAEFLLGLFFDPEDGGDMFLLHIG